MLRKKKPPKWLLDRVRKPTGKQLEWAKAQVKKPKRDSGTRSKVKRGPVRDPKHLARVRAESCLFCERFPPNEAHHVRAFRLRTMGVRPSDYLAVPLCNACHRLLHSGKEEHFWNGALHAPGPWIANFSTAGREAIEELRKP